LLAVFPLVPPSARRQSNQEKVSVVAPSVTHQISRIICGIGAGVQIEQCHPAYTDCQKIRSLQVGQGSGAKGGNGVAEISAISSTTAAGASREEISLAASASLSGNFGLGLMA
jgi:hypothetical protein